LVCFFSINAESITMEEKAHDHHSDLPCAGEHDSGDLVWVSGSNETKTYGKSAMAREHEE
jgi:hypothetical protein